MGNDILTDRLLRLEEDLRHEEEKARQAEMPASNLGSVSVQRSERTDLLPDVPKVDLGMSDQEIGAAPGARSPHSELISVLLYADVADVVTCYARFIKADPPFPVQDLMSSLKDLAERWRDEQKVGARSPQDETPRAKFCTCGHITLMALNYCTKCGGGLTDPGRAEAAALDRARLPDLEKWRVGADARTGLATLHAPDGRTNSGGILSKQFVGDVEVYLAAHVDMVLAADRARLPSAPPPDSSYRLNLPAVKALAESLRADAEADIEDKRDLFDGLISCIEEIERLRAEAARGIPAQVEMTLNALVKEAAEIMEIVYAGNFPAGIESFLIRAHQAIDRPASRAPEGREP